jgi:hypothetical protein
MVASTCFKAGLRTESDPASRQRTKKLRMRSVSDPRMTVVATAQQNVEAPRVGTDGSRGASCMILFRPPLAGPIITWTTSVRRGPADASRSPIALAAPPRWPNRRRGWSSSSTSPPGSAPLDLFARAAANLPPTRTAPTRTAATVSRRHPRAVRVVMPRGPKPIDNRAMTPAERVRHHRARSKAQLPPGAAQNGFGWPMAIQNSMQDMWCRLCSN